MPRRLAMFVLIAAVVVTAGAGAVAAATPNLAGTWSASGYTCPTGVAQPPETIRITQTGRQVVAVKVTGDPCVPAGSETFSGTLPDGPGVAQLSFVGGVPAAPASQRVPGSITITDDGRFAVAIGVFGTPIEFVRVADGERPPGSSLLGIPTPGEAITVRNVALSAVVTLLLLLLVAVPSTLFNNTLEANLDHFRSLLPRWLRRDAGHGGGPSFWHTASGFGVYVLLAAVLYSFLQPGWGANAATALTFAGFGISMIATSLLGIRSRRFYLGLRRQDGSGHLEVELATLLFAAVCVVASRVAGFVPGYFYGVLAVFVADRQLEQREEGEVTAFGVSVVVLMSVLAWLLLSPLRVVAGDDPSSVRALPLALAGGLFMGGVEATVIGMTPLRFLPGATLRRWDQRVWLALYASGGFLFSLVLLHPGLATTHESSVAATLSLAGAFGLASLAFWDFHRRRALRATPVDGEAPAAVHEPQPEA